MRRLYKNATDALITAAALHDEAGSTGALVQDLTTLIRLSLILNDVRSAFDFATMALEEFCDDPTTTSLLGNGTGGTHWHHAKWALATPLIANDIMGVGPGGGGLSVLVTVPVQVPVGHASTGSRCRSRVGVVVTALVVVVLLVALAVNTLLLQGDTVVARRVIERYVHLEPQSTRSQPVTCAAIEGGAQVKLCRQGGVSCTPGTYFWL